MIYVLIGRLTQFVLALAGTRLLTTLLPPEEVGRIALLTALTAFFAMLLVNPVGMYINRHLHEWADKGRVRLYFRLYWKYLLIVCALAALLCAMLNASGLLALHSRTVWLLVLVCGSIFFNTVNQTALPSLNMLGHRVSFIVLTLATLAAGLGASVALTAGLQARAEFWLLGLILGQAAFGWIGVTVLYRKTLLTGPPQTSAAPLPLRELWTYAWPVALAVGLGWAQMQGSRFILDHQVGLAQLGLYSAGYGLSASLLAAFELILTTWFQPLLYRRVSQQRSGFDAAAWNDYAAAVLPVLLFATTLLAMAAPEVTGLLLGAAYQQASQYVMLGAIAESTRVLIGALGLVAHLRLQTRLLLAPNVAGVLVTLVLVLLLVPVLGPGGAAIAIAIGGALVALCLYWYMGRTSAIVLPWRAIGTALAAGAGFFLLIAGARTYWHADGRPLASLLFLTGVAVLASPLFYLLLRTHINPPRQEPAL